MPIRGSLVAIFLSGIISCAYQSDTVFVNTAQGTFTKSVKSLKELRDENVAKQEYDFSCGAGSLVTILKYHFGEDLSEKELIELIFKDKTDEELIEIIEEGLSMLDLKQAAEKLGYKADGYRLKLHHLDKLSIPVIVFLESKDFKHFSVFKGVRQDRVYLADPGGGNMRMSLSRFSKQWEGFTLVVYRASEEPSEYPGIKLTDTVIVRPELLSVRSMDVIGRKHGISSSF